MTDFTNLLQETIYALQSNAKEEKDVLYVSATYCNDKDEYVSNFLSWEDFKFYASEISYDSGYGTAYINLGLKIVGLNFWLERSEYDGAESWDYKSIPIKPKTQLHIGDDVLAALLDDGSPQSVKTNNLEAKLLSLKEKESIEKEISPDTPSSQVLNTTKKTSKSNKKI